jgi:tRNA A37 threonylcarbamoyladenosine synthetase subunit TsaC/SUA5/YrdC
VDLVIDGGYCGIEPSTVVDLVSEQPEIMRYGKGDVEAFLT